jgi:hypothetical protein
MWPQGERFDYIMIVKQWRAFSIIPRIYLQKILKANPDKHSLAICYSSSSRSDGYVTCPDRISTGLRLASLFLPYTHLCIFFIDLSWHVVCFSHGFLLRLWHSLHIFSHSMIFIVSSVILLSSCAFRILEYLLIGIFSWEIVHENPFLSLCWVDLDIFMPYE